MKKLFTLCVILIMTVRVAAQSPQKMSYQAVVRNASGVLQANQAVGMKISIPQGSATGTPVYVETQSTTTNANGLVTIEIGGGTTVFGSFSGIDWSSGTYFIKTETDPTGGTNYTIKGTSQILSVPYALYSKTAGNEFSNDLLVNGLTVGTGKGANYNNTAVGIQALYSNTGGVNTAIGAFALTSSTTGYANTAIGCEALYSNTTGYYNTSIGNRALWFNTIGHSNIATGDQALCYNSTGSNNAASGGVALYSNTTGNLNTANGYAALHSNTTGSNNTAIGYFADVASSNLTNATVIGSDAIVNASNNFVFGNSEVVGWGFGVAPGAAAIRVGSSSSNGNGATLTLTGVWTNASDISKKYDIENINYGLNEVMKLRPVTYKLKGSNNQDIGFIAQEVKKIIPEIVYGEEGEMTLSYGQIASVYAKAFQEQQQQIEFQQKQIDELKALVSTLIANQTAQVNK